MNIQSLGRALGESLGSSLTVRMSGASGGWSAPSLKPVSSGRITSLFQTMVPTVYTKLQEERFAMVDLGAKPEPGSLQNGYRQETSHAEGRRHADRASRSSVTLSDCGDVSYSEMAPILAERRLSGAEAEVENEEDKEEGHGSAVQNMPKESPLAMTLQILVPFFLAGFGTVSAGMVLDIVQVRSAGLKAQSCVCDDTEMCDQLYRTKSSYSQRCPLVSANWKRMMYF